MGGGGGGGWLYSWSYDQKNGHGCILGHDKTYLNEFLFPCSHEFPNEIWIRITQ